MAKDILWVHQLDAEDVDIAGLKASRLGEIFKLGISIPSGFVITTEVFTDLTNRLFPAEKLRLLESKLDSNNQQLLQETQELFRKSVTHTQLPKELSQQIKGSLDELVSGKRGTITASLSLRSPLSSVTTSIFIHEPNLEKITAATKTLWLSLFENKSLLELNKGRLGFGAAVLFSKLPTPDVSGQLFTVSVEKPKETLTIEAAFGAGALLRLSNTQFDSYSINKKDSSLAGKSISNQLEQTLLVAGNRRKIPIPAVFGEKQKLSEEALVKLTRIAKKIENHFLYPQRVEFLIEEEEIFVIDFEPLETILEEVRISPSVRSKKIFEGESGFAGIATGPLRIFEPKKLNRNKPGDITVIKELTKNQIPLLRKSSGIIVTQKKDPAVFGLMERLGKPVIFTNKRPLSQLKEPRVVTIDGLSGKVFLGSIASGGQNVIEFLPKNSNTSNSPSKTATKVFVNLSEPRLAVEIAKKEVDGVGLLRAELLLAKSGEHPRKVVNEGKQKQFIANHAKNLVEAASAFGERDVIYRTSDFRTDEYITLKGGSHEKAEKNPLLGLRGASRYLADKEVFLLEIEAVKEARSQSKNIWLSLPFVRTVEELEGLKKIISAAGLYRSSSFKIFLNVETPSNVILIDEFLDTGIDGVCIEQKDLTSLILGIDPENESLSYLTASDEAVISSFEKVIKATRKAGLIAGFVASERIDSDLLEKLVESGISFISVTADETERTRELLSEAERKVVSARKKT